MANLCIAQTPSAYGFPLLIKGLLESGVTRNPEQEIVSADSTRLTYRQFAERVGRLASGLASLGVEPGDTVGSQIAVLREGPPDRGGRHRQDLS